MRRWRTDDGPAFNSGLVTLTVIFQEIWTSIAKKHFISGENDKSIDSSSFICITFIVIFNIDQLFWSGHQVLLQYNVIWQLYT